MQSILIGLMVAAQLLVFLLLIVLAVTLKGFQRSTPTIRGEEDLNRLRRLVTMQMYGALLGFVQWVPFVAWPIGKFLFDALTWTDLLVFVIAPFAVNIGVALAFAPIADKVRATPAANPQLEAERDHIADVWVNQRFPQW